MARARSEEEIFQLILLGTTWVQEKARHRNGWTANGVLHTLKLIGGISASQHYTVTSKPSMSLRNHVVARSEILPRRSGKITGRLRASDKLVVVLTDTPLFFGDKIFTPRGYRILVTDRGREVAHGHATRFAPHVTRDGFMAQWAAHLTQMKGMYAAGREPGTA